MSGLDPYERPPNDLKEVFKYYQGIDLDSLKNDTELIQNVKCLSLDSGDPKIVRTIDQRELCFDQCIDEESRMIPVLEWSNMPGLQFIPGILSDKVQLELLSRMLHRDLADRTHQTNIHKHHDIPYELTIPKNDGNGSKSFFNSSPGSSTQFQPLDATVHKPFDLSKFLNKKLRWLTLGGQYDWTKKVYPEESPPSFPDDIAKLIRSGFPEMVPQAAIVNVYSPGDTLALHRDVSEASDNGLVSISIGCEAIFVAGLASVEGHTRWRAFLLQSGDAIYMSGVSRYAWHGVPKILRNTCPEIIRDWPAGNSSSLYDDWKGWMAGKRINLNVRQIFD